MPYFVIRLPCRERGRGIVPRFFDRGTIESRQNDDDFAVRLSPPSLSSLPPTDLSAEFVRILGTRCKESLGFRGSTAVAAIRKAPAAVGAAGDAAAGARKPAGIEGERAIAREPRIGE